MAVEALWFSWKGDAVTRVEVRIIASNCAAFPPGSHAGAHAENHVLIELAGYLVEDITYSTTRRQVNVATALGYQFTISTGDYYQLMLE